MHIVLDGGIFRRQAEGVPAHGMQDIEALGLLEAGHHVAQGIVAHMPHMDAARRIGEHLQDIIFGAGVVFAGQEALTLFPDLLPFGFGFADVVTLVGTRHGGGLLFIFQGGKGKGGDL